MLHRWRRLAFAALAGAAACGTLEDGAAPGGADGGPDAGASDSAADGPATDAGDAGDAGDARACALDRPFGAPRELGELDLAKTQDAPRLSSDELTIVFHAQIADGVSELRIAHRASRTTPFDPPAPLPGFPPASAAGQSDVTPFLTDDGRTLFFASSRNNVGGLQLFVLERSDAGAWGGVPGLVFGDTIDRRFPYLGPDGRLWYAKVTAADGGGQQSAIWTSQPDGGAERVLPAPINVGKFDYSPVLTADGRALYFTSYRSGDGLEIHRAELLADGGIGDVVELTELVAQGLLDIHAGWISPDECRIYFSNGTATGPLEQRLYVAERPAP